jgi:mRNA-degrading endonuclease RelE of RelBE toxin-antitoxin system
LAQFDEWKTNSLESKHEHILVQKVWNFCHTLRDDVGYGDYLGNNSPICYSQSWRMNTRERIAGMENPRITDKALIGPLPGLWRYRVDDCRVIFDIQDGALRVLVVPVGNRREVYR